MIAFGPIPSRRLGRSLGINNIPPKHCDYSCIYCQLGRTADRRAYRSSFCSPHALRLFVEARVREVSLTGEHIDFLTFVSDGEPTLDLRLGHEIDLLRPLGIRIAVISNGSLIWQNDVRHDLALADWVSLKVDSVDEQTWRRINRPHHSLDLRSIRRGMQQFAEDYPGQLATETMLVQGINDSEEQLSAVAEFIAKLRPQTHYLAVPTRPPAERWVAPPDEETLNRAYQIFAERLPRVELLVAYEGSEFTATGSVEHDILSITSVHPMREDAVRELLEKTGAQWSAVQKLIDRGLLSEAWYRDRRFLVRKLEESKNRSTGERLAG